MLEIQLNILNVVGKHIYYRNADSKKIILVSQFKLTSIVSIILYTINQAFYHLIVFIFQFLFNFSTNFLFLKKIIIIKVSMQKRLMQKQKIKYALEYSNTMQMFVLRITYKKLKHSSKAMYTNQILILKN